MVVYLNAYMHSVMDQSDKQEICGARWTKDITLGEMMKFYGMLFHMVLPPKPGNVYPSCCDGIGWHPYIIHMPLICSPQI